MSFCGENHVGLWEKLCRFVGKIKSVFGKNQAGLWEKFVGRKTSMKNTHLYTGKKYRIIYVYSICRGTESQNVYLTENSLKLKTVQADLLKMDFRQILLGLKHYLSLCTFEKL